MKYRLKRFKINSDNSVSFSSNVYLNNLGFSEIPFKIRSVKGDLYLQYNNLSNLKNLPKFVGGTLNVSDNILTTLEGCPEEVGESFIISFNNLENLDYFPKKIGGGINMVHNKIETVDENILPEIINGFFTFNNNPLISLRNFPRIVQDSLGGIDYTDLPEELIDIWMVERLKDTTDILMDISDLSVFRKDHTINNTALKELINTYKKD
jgi:hypothetical protein